MEQLLRNASGQSLLRVPRFIRIRHRHRELHCNSTPAPAICSRCATGFSRHTRWQSSRWTPAPIPTPAPFPTPTPTPTPAPAPPPRIPAADTGAAGPPGWQPMDPDTDTDFDSDSESGSGSSAGTFPHGYRWPAARVSAAHLRPRRPAARVRRLGRRPSSHRCSRGQLACPPQPPPLRPRPPPPPAASAGLGPAWPEGLDHARD